MSITAMFIIAGLVLSLAPAVAAKAAAVAAKPATVTAAATVGLTVTPIVTGLTIPWDVLFTPDGTMIYNQRAGGLWARRTNGTTTALTADFSDLWVSGEVGLMGMVVDPDFAGNRQIYTCQSRISGGNVDIRVIKWSIDAGYSTATRVGGPVVSGITQVATAHAGCRLRFDNDKLLYISTGDNLSGTAPQDLNVLNGKVLRVTRDGTPAPGNPYLGSSNPTTRLIYTSGHRNPQGLSLRPGTNEMWLVEQGTGADDEVNRLVSGGNYGWNPRVPPSTVYDQNTPMTNPNVPGALQAVFSTGSPTLALSGGVWLSGQQWGPWNGSFVAAALKASSVRVLGITSSNTVSSVESPAELAGTYGRLRSPLLGPDGALYLTTSNGGGTDRILRIESAFKPNPIGSLDIVTNPAQNELLVAGWAADPAAPGQREEVHVYVSGPGGTRGTPGIVTGGSRPDVAAAFPWAGGSTGFNAMVRPVNEGTNTICAYAINVSPPHTNPSIGCKTIQVRNAFGYLDLIHASQGELLAAGWALNPNRPTEAVEVHLYDTGPTGTRGYPGFRAGASRPDVGSVFPGYGSDHGLNAAIPWTSAGTHNVCAYAITTGGGNANFELGCRTVTVPALNAFGSLDLVSSSSGKIVAAGWALNPNIRSEHVEIHVYDTSSSGTRGYPGFRAETNRPDVANAFAGYGADHGYWIEFPAAEPGQHKVCTYAITKGGGNGNTLLGCQDVMVAP